MSGLRSGWSSFWGSRPRLRRASIGVSLFLVRYSPVAILLALISSAVITPAIYGARPMPQTPPDGYRSDDLSVRVSWSRGEDESERLALEVSTTPDFEKPVYRRIVRGSTQTLPPLERGKTYYWRLEPGGVVATFSTSEHGVHF